MTKSIQINIVSRGLYVLFMFTGIFGSVLVTLLISTQVFQRLNFKPNQFIFLGIVFLVWYLINKITKDLSQGKVDLRLDKEGVKIIWLKQFFLHKRRNISFKWEEVRDYMYQPEQHFDLFRIRLHNKKKIKLSLNEKNEEFHFFYIEFEEFIKNLSSTNEDIQIKRAKTIYETTYGLIMAVILGLMLVGVIFMFIFIKPKNSNMSTYFYLGATVMGSLFFILQVYRIRKSAKEDAR